MVQAQLYPAGVLTANERLKNRFRAYFWSSVVCAAAVHFLILALWPSIMIADVSIDSASMDQIEIPLDVEIPPPPEALSRPAVPIASMDVDFDLDATIDPGTFDANPPTELPPPPVGNVDVSASPGFTPYEVRPELRNRAEYTAALVRRYPPRLKDAGIGGTVLLWIFVDEEGIPRNTRVVESSGYEHFDRVAESLVLEVARFSPALNRDQRVPVWIQIPITFQTE